MELYFNVHFVVPLTSKSNENFNKVSSSSLELFAFLHTYPQIMTDSNLVNDVIKFYILHHFELKLITHLFMEYGHFMEMDLWGDFINKNI